MEYNSVCWFEVYANDLKRAQKFYESLLDIKFETMPKMSDDLEMLGFPGKMENAGATGALCKMKGYEAGGGSTIIYFGSEDCAVQEKRVTALGGSVIKPKTSLGEHGNMCLLKDTEGNIIGIFSMS